jgi:hypothetical protein
MSDHRRPKRSNIDIVFSQGVVPVTKKAKTDTCSRRLPPKIRSLYNQANYCYDVVASADPDLRVYVFGALDVKNTWTCHNTNVTKRQGRLINTRQ